MKKYIILIMGCLLLLGCRQEVLEPEQMIQGMFALDDGTGLTDQYFLFDNGYLDIFSSDEPLPLAGKRIWNYDASLFKRDFKQLRYTISEKRIHTSGGPNGEIELKDDILTIDGKKYSVLEGFESKPYTSIVVDEEVVIPFIGQENSFPYSIENPIPSGELTVGSADSWIQDLRAQNGRIVFNTTTTTIERKARIDLSYTKANPVSIDVKQSPSTFIRLENNSLSIDYSASRQTLGYSIENPLSASSLTATTTAAWISAIQVLDNEIRFNVSENNSGTDRNSTMTLSYKGAPDVEVSITQKYTAAKITLAPNSQTVGYKGGVFSFAFSVSNPREGVSIEVSSQAEWIIIVNTSANTVNYKIVEYSGFHSREGKINLRYGNTSESFIVTQGGSPTIPEGAVDLGLSVLWASSNLGDSGLCRSPGVNGSYYAWGETASKLNYAWSTYKWGTSSSGPFSRYNTISSYGTVDNRTTLLAEDDVAHAKLGGAWRMPTKAEFTELLNNCTKVWTTYNGTKGYKFTSNKTGYTWKWIFLPAAGYREGTSLSLVGSAGLYWSSSLYSYPGSAYIMSFDSDLDAHTVWTSRYWGFSVRPVSD